MFKLIASVVLLLISVQAAKSSYLDDADRLDETFPTLYATEKTAPFDEFSNSLSETTIYSEGIDLQEDLDEKEKVQAYNVNNGNNQANIPQHAVENSPSHISCSEAPEKCITPSITSTPTATPSSTLTPTPEVSEPTITIFPLPIEDSYPKRCLEVVCPMVACLHEPEGDSEVEYDGCKCPCENFPRELEVM